jgi:alanine racemase
MHSPGNYSTWIEVDRGAIESNVRLLREKTNVEVMAVVKANGYGHGTAPVAQAALRGGATWCGVARIEEAIELRQAGIDCPVLVLGFIPVEKIETAILNNISISVWDDDQIKFASIVARNLEIKAKLHLKVDTGMSRLGIIPENAVQMSRAILDSAAVIYEGIFTHFARADESDKTPTERQESCFQDVIESLVAVNIDPPLVHAANSAAAISYSSSWFNLIRPGIAIYGLDPSPDCKLPAGFKPALSWKSVLSQVKTLPRGRGVSYGHEYTTTRDEKIGTLPVGYGDGYRRISGNQVLIRGVRVPVIGRVCMDQVMVQLDSIPEAQEGDEAVLIGSQGDQLITVDDVAKTWKTINYEVICGLGARVPREYL